MKFVDISMAPPATHELKYIESKIGPVASIVEDNPEHIEKLRKWLHTTCDVRTTPMEFDGKVMLHVECHQNEKETIEYFVNISEMAARMICTNHFIAIVSDIGDVLLLTGQTGEEFLRTAFVAKNLMKELGFDGFDRRKMK